MNRLIRSIALATFVAAPASAQLAGVQSANQRSREMQSMPQLIMLDSLASWTDVPFAPILTLKSAKLALESMNIPFETMDSTRGVIYNRQLKARRSFANRPLSWTLRCGTGGLTGGDNADNWLVTLGYSVFVISSGHSDARLGVAIVGSATNPASSGRQTVECATTGNFEQAVANAVKLQLAAAR